jgi:hypothetical protein
MRPIAIIKIVVNFLIKASDLFALITTSKIDLSLMCGALNKPRKFWRRARDGEFDATLLF